MKKRVIIALVLSVFLFLTACATTQNNGQGPNPFQSGDVENSGQMYKLFLSADIPNVKIYINGNYMGSRKIATHFRAGSYKIEVKAKGYKTWTQDLLLNQSWTIVAKMVPETEAVVE